MLNISRNSITKYIDRSAFKSLYEAENKYSGNVTRRLLYSSLFISTVILFLPWTQNISANGEVIALKPGQRPQNINSVIAGKIENWHVQEGDYVKKGDTILFLSEVKDDYLDPELISRTGEKLKAKEMSAQSYMEKVKALDNQIDALLVTGGLKLEQAENKLEQAKLKIKSDSIDVKAADINYQIAEKQFERIEQLYKDGLRSLTDYESRKLKLREAEAKWISAQNKLLTSENELINAKIELNSIGAEFKNAVSKAESEKYTALSNMYDTEALVTQLQNQFMNYSIRSGMYYVKAPQNGYITKAIRSGVGEIIKEGETIVTIMPAEYDLAVQTYVRPIDLPLVNKGQSVQIIFDGWPAIIFSGWPNISHGTYKGNVVAIDNFISENGLFRILVKPDPESYDWPTALRVGSGTKSILFLNDVPVWYELWRKFNGFPPDFYETSQAQNNQIK